MLSYYIARSRPLTKLVGSKTNSQEQPTRPLQTGIYPLHNNAVKTHRRTCRNLAHHMKTADMNTRHDL